MSKIEDRVCKKIQERADMGLKKYGVTVERDDLSFIEWMTHLQEELMDASVYIEKVIESEKLIEDLTDCLHDMVKIAEFDDWDLSTTGRQLVLKDCKKLLEKL